MLHSGCLLSATGTATGTGYGRMQRTMRNRLEAVADIRSTVGLGAGGDSKLVGEELRRLPHTEQSNVIESGRHIH